MRDPDDLYGSAILAALIVLCASAAYLLVRAVFA